MLQRLAEPDDPQRWERVRAALLAARGRRPQPGRDDKVVTAWNGLAVAALAEGAVLLDRPDWLAAAERCADLLRDLHRDADGRLRRTSREAASPAGTPGCWRTTPTSPRGCSRCTRPPATRAGWPTRAALLDVVLERFGDGAGGFYDTADDAEELVRRPQDPTDGATPGGASAAAAALLTYAALTGSARHRDAAETALGTLAPLIGRHARFAGWALAAAEALVAGPAEVVVLDRPDLLAVARLATAPGAVVVTGGPLAEGRAPGAAYVCRGSVCELPTTDADRLRRPAAGGPAAEEHVTAPPPLCNGVST